MGLLGSNRLKSLLHLKFIVLKQVFLIRPTKLSADGEEILFCLIFQLSPGMRVIAGIKKSPCLSFVFKIILCLGHLCLIPLSAACFWNNPNPTADNCGNKSITLK